MFFFLLFMILDYNFSRWLGHRARECFNAWKPLSSLPGLMVSSQPRLTVHPCHGKKHVDRPPPFRRSSTSPTPVVPDVQSTWPSKPCCSALSSMLVSQESRVSWWEQGLLLTCYQLCLKPLLWLRSLLVQLRLEKTTSMAVSPPC
jgi:hypothetical protein